MGADVESDALPGVESGGGFAEPSKTMDPPRLAACWRQPPPCLHSVLTPTTSSARSTPTPTTTALPRTTRARAARARQKDIHACRHVWLDELG
eukprot:8781506-Pyramimonas_sp.AAC.1